MIFRFNFTIHSKNYTEQGFLHYRKSAFVVHNFRYKHWSEHHCGFVSLVGCGKTNGAKIMPFTMKKHFRSDKCFEDSK